jgi:mono/diheme cytochrome c family protein
MILAALALAGCGQGAEPTPRPTSTPLPRFEQVHTPTEPAVIATAVATATARSSQNTVALDPTAIARGQDNWRRLECASCHGENGEGGAGSIGDREAPPLTGLTLTEDEFIDWLRTGGTLGNDHLFSTDRLSDRGGRNLYQFVLSLSAN